MSGMDSQSVKWMGVCGTKGGDFKWKSLGFSSFLTLKAWSPPRCTPVCDRRRVLCGISWKSTHSGSLCVSVWECDSFALLTHCTTVCGAYFRFMSLSLLLSPTFRLSLSDTHICVHLCK